MIDKLEITTKTNPAPLGYFGFSMTLFLSSLFALGLVEFNAALVVMGLFMGGWAQVIAGVMEVGKKNTFGFVAFISYGMFWPIIVTILALNTKNLMVSNKAEISVALALWGMLAAGLFIASLRRRKTTQLFYLSLTLLFIMLGYDELTVYEGQKVYKAAGIMGIITSLIAFYEASIQLMASKFQMNEALMKKIEEFREQEKIKNSGKGE